MKKALIVIDVQNYFVVEKAKSLPSRIASHIRSTPYDAVLFTKFRNDATSNFHKLLGFEDVTQAPATDLHEDIVEFTTSENVFEKTTYSGMKAPGLVPFLEKEGIATIDLCGISADACVLATAFDAFDLGYHVEILDTLVSVSSAREDLGQAAKVIVSRNLRPREVRVKREL